MPAVLVTAASEQGGTALAKGLFPVLSFRPLGTSLPISSDQTGRPPMPGRWPSSRPSALTSGLSSQR